MSSPVLLAALGAFVQGDSGFEVTFTGGVGLERFDGRALVFLSKTAREPRTWDNWARLEPVIGEDFTGVAPDEVMRLAGDAASFPVPLADLEGGRYFAQAVLDLRRDQPFPGTAAGNPCSAPVAIELHPGQDWSFRLVCDRTIPEAAMAATRWAHPFQVRSELLSEFCGRPVLMRALVHLPEAWYLEPDRRFPLHLVGDVPMITVYPDPSCANGYCGFADSENNGPWGEAFVRELLPAIEEEYRGIGSPARYLVGHSSGGWSALWLMCTYPDAFDFAWASSPDPVDFRDFLGVDLYAERANLYFDERGEPRAFCQLGNIWPVGYTLEYGARESVLRGGILSSFEALFSPRAADGTPERLWDRRDGTVRADVARAWSRYDIGRILRERWSELGSKLDGKLAITIGDHDNFLLQGSVALLRSEMQELGADVSVRVVPGDHFSVRSYENYSEETLAIARAFGRLQRDGR
jgi:S-formylglutathione hydrolase FrmB